MNIFIEASSIFKTRSGVGQYTKRLTEAVARAKPEYSISLFGFKFWTRPLPPQDIKIPNVKYQIVRFMPGRVYNMLFRMGLGLPVDVLLRKRPDVIIYPNFIRWPVLNRKIKTVVVIHDLSFVYFPQFASPINRQDNERFVPKSMAKADCVITVSESAKKQIIDHYKIEAQKIVVVPNAVDPGLFYRRKPNEITAIREKYHLPRKYILYTGTLEPRKNIEGILDAYIALDGKTRAEYALVLAGGRGWQDESIHSAIKKLQKVGEQIILTGYVPDEDLPAMYSGAALFVWPSFYEGFGVPPLEAMACGVPVITSDNSSLPEVVGEAAIKLKAEDTAAITKAMARVLSDSKLAAGLRQKGLVQAKKFSWDKSAQDLITVFNELTR